MTDIKKLEAAFREGYRAGYHNGEDDCAQFDSGFGSRSIANQRSDQDSAWEDSDAHLNENTPSPTGGPVIAPFVYSNQQRDTGDPSRGVCSINAFSLITGIPWAEAKELLTKAGWRNRIGVPRGWPKRVPGWRFIRVTRKVYTIGKFLKTHPQGRFIVRKKGHIFAVIDGRVYDWKPQGSMVRLTHAWRVEKKSENSACHVKEYL